MYDEMLWYLYQNDRDPILKRLSWLCAVCFMLLYTLSNPRDSASLFFAFYLVLFLVIPWLPSRYDTYHEGWSITKSKYTCDYVDTILKEDYATLRRLMIADFIFIPIVSWPDVLIETLQLKGDFARLPGMCERNTSLTRGLEEIEKRKKVVEEWKEQDRVRDEIGPIPPPDYYKTDAGRALSYASFDATGTGRLGRIMTVLAVLLLAFLSYKLYLAVMNRNIRVRSSTRPYHMVIIRRGTPVVDDADFSCLAQRLIKVGCMFTILRLVSALATRRDSWIVRQIKRSILDSCTRDGIVDLNLLCCVGNVSYEEVCSVLRDTSYSRDMHVFGVGGERRKGYAKISKGPFECDMILTQLGQGHFAFGAEDVFVSPNHVQFFRTPKCERKTREYKHNVVKLKNF